jgi:hypothetical protein
MRKSHSPSFINIRLWVMAISTNAKPAPRKMWVSTVKRTLKGSENMTENEVNCRTESSCESKSQGLGEPKTKEEIAHIYPYLEPSVMAVYFGYPVLDVEKKNPLLITKITTSLLKLCGFANRATSSGIKN